MKGTKTIVKTVGERVGGGRPGPARASLTALAVGAAVAASVYRALRS